MQLTQMNSNYIREYSYFHPAYRINRFLLLPPPLIYKYDSTITHPPMIQIHPSPFQLHISTTNNDMNVIVIVEQIQTAYPYGLSRILISYRSNDDLCDYDLYLYLYIHMSWKRRIIIISIVQANRAVFPANINLHNPYLIRRDDFTLAKCPAHATAITTQQSEMNDPITTQTAYGRAAAAINQCKAVLSSTNANPYTNTAYLIIMQHDDISQMCISQKCISQVIQFIQMAEEEQKKKKKGPPFQTLPNKQVIPLLGFGTYKLQDEKVITQMLRKGLQQGFCKHIDTARYYNNEIPLGKAIQTVISENRTKREDLFITTKIFNHVDTDVQAQIKEALSLMQLKYFDAVYLHWPFVDPTFPIVNHQSLEVFWSKMESLVHKGYTKHLAVSNFNGQLLSQLLTICKIKPALLQIQVHPYLQNIPLAELAQKNGIVVIAHTPLMRADGLQRNDLNILKDEVIGEIAAKYGRKESQIILKSTLYRNIGVIPKTSCAAHLIQNCESWTVELVQDDMKKIRLLNRNYRVCDARNLLKQLANWE